MRAVQILPAAAIVAVSLWEVWAARHDATSVPGDDDWRRAAQVVREQAQPGDLIVFAPEWVDPVGRMMLGDKLAIADAARMDAAKYARIWELSIRGARAPETAGLTPAAVTEGDVTVRRYDQKPVHVLANARDLLAGAKGIGAVAHRELAEVGFRPHDCIEVTPSAKVPVRIAMTMPLGTRLVGYVGLADVFTRRDIRAPGRLQVEIGGQVVASAEPGVEDGWVRFEAATQPGQAEVTFVASADAPQRMICFAAEARE